MENQVLIQKLKHYMQKREQEMVEFLASLVRIKSITYEEGAAIAWLRTKLEEFGYDEVLVDQAGNCLARMGSGNTRVLADAHIDTVDPGDPLDWGFNPLEPRIVNQSISGRGVVDDKGPLTALVFAGRAIKDLGLDTEVSFYLSASISEEDVEGSCVKAMMDQLSWRPDAIIIAESSDNHIIRGHKGRALIRMEVKGKAAHASEAQMGENALIKAIPLIQALDSYDECPSDDFLGKGTLEVTKVICDTPSLNTIPGKVTVIADRRISAGETKQELLTELQTMLKLSNATASIDMENVTTYTGYTINQEDYFPSWVLQETHPLIVCAKEAFLQVTTKPPIVTKWNFCTNATYLCGITGIPSVGFGPGDHSLCHSDHEILSFEELITASQIYTMIALLFARHQVKITPKD